MSPWPPAPSASESTPAPKPLFTPGPGAIPKPHVFTIASDLQGVVVRYPAGAAKMFLWLPQEVIGKLHVDAFHLREDSETLLPRMIQAALEAGEAEEHLTMLRKDGSRFEAILTVRPRMQDGAHIGFERTTRPG